MKRMSLFLFGLMLAVASIAAEEIIKLPKTNFDRGGKIMDAFDKRQSTREYASRALVLSDLSDLLWAANGVISPVFG